MVNKGAGADRLLRVETAIAGAAETHETRFDEGGIARMIHHPDGFEVPPAGTLRLEPGGRHVMLLEPELPGDRERAAVTLHFERGGALEVEAAVERPLGPGDDHSGHH